MTGPSSPAVRLAIVAADAAPETAVQPVPGELAGRGGRLIGNALALVLSRPLTWLCTIGLTILLPRYLGDVNLGRINFAFAFADWCGLLVGLGIGRYLVKEVARRGLAAGPMVLNALVLRSIVALGVGVAASVIATLLGYDELTRRLIILLTAHMLLTVIVGLLTSSLEGMQQLRDVAVIDAVSRIVQLGLVALVLVQGRGPTGVAVAYILADLFALVWFLLAVHRRLRLTGPIDLGSWRPLMVGGLPFLVWEAALLTYARVDVIILSIFTHDAVLGWYGAAYRIVSIPLFLPVIVATVTFPALSASVREPAAFNALARRAAHAAVLMSVPMALGLMVVPDKIVQLLGYPEGFVNSTVPIALLAASLPLVALNMIVGSTLNAGDRQRHWALAGVAAAVLNLALNFVAIPYTQRAFGNGAMGAAAVTSLTEVFLLIAGQWLLPAGVLDRATLVGLLKCVLAGLAMAGVVLMAREAPILITVLLGASTYGAGSLLMGTVSVGDLGRVRRYLGERRRPAYA